MRVISDDYTPSVVDSRYEPRPTRRTFLIASAAARHVAALCAAQARATIAYWNGLTGADGKVMDELIDRFTREYSHEQQRLPWADLYPSCRSRFRR
jgi:ABC-type glycerol-3-phosphate transport system substrate-binding protein